MSLLRCSLVGSRAMFRIVAVARTGWLPLWRAFAAHSAGKSDARGLQLTGKAGVGLAMIRRGLSFGP